MMKSWTQVCLGESHRSTGTRATQVPALPRESQLLDTRTRARSPHALIKNWGGLSFCLILFKTSRASAPKPVGEQDHVGMGMRARCWIPSCDLVRTVENLPLLEPYGLVVLIIIMAC